MLRNVTVAELADIEEPVALMMAIWRHRHVLAERHTEVHQAIGSTTHHCRSMHSQELNEAGVEADKLVPQLGRQYTLNQRSRGSDIYNMAAIQGVAGPRTGASTGTCRV